MQSREQLQLLMKQNNIGGVVAIIDDRARNPEPADFACSLFNKLRC